MALLWDMCNFGWSNRSNRAKKKEDKNRGWESHAFRWVGKTKSRLCMLEGHYIRINQHWICENIKFMTEYCDDVHYDFLLLAHTVRTRHTSTHVMLSLLHICTSYARILVHTCKSNTLRRRILWYIVVELGIQNGTVQMFSFFRWSIRPIWVPYTTKNTRMCCVFI